MFKTILVLHIVGASGLGILIIAALVAIWKNQLSSLKSYASNIGLGLGLQLTTGSLLVLTSRTHGTVWSFCNKIGLYLAIVAAIEGLLFYKIKNSQNFPVRIIASSTLVGAGFVAWALAFGF